MWINTKNIAIGLILLIIIILTIIYIHTRNEGTYVNTDAFIEAEKKEAINLDEEYTLVILNKYKKEQGKIQTAETLSNIDQKGQLYLEEQKQEYYIKINIEQNVVNIYTKDTNGEFSIPYKAMICSTRKGYTKRRNI